MGGVPKKRHSKSKVGRRRSHLALATSTKKTLVCKSCGGPKTAHRICKQCGAK